MLKIFTVYDSKAEAYLQPFFAPTIAVAIRSFTKAADNPSHDFHHFPGDFTLFELGEWDEQAGTTFMYDAQVSLGLALHHQTPEETS